MRYFSAAALPDIMDAGIRCFSGCRRPSSSTTHYGFPITSQWRWPRPKACR
jgi:hypothetical protein